MSLLLSTVEEQIRLVKGDPRTETEHRIALDKALESLDEYRTIRPGGGILSEEQRMLIHQFEEFIIEEYESLLMVPESRKRVPKVTCVLKRYREVFKTANLVDISYCIQCMIPNYENFAAGDSYNYKSRTMNTWEKINEIIKERLCMSYITIPINV